jgi:YVTN family beta-propeller protein
VFGISSNVTSDLANNAGTAMQIDVSGDSIIAETALSGTDAPLTGWNPTHAAVQPNDARLFVASAGSAVGGLDVVAAFSPAFQSTIATGFGPVTAVGLPSQIASISAISEAGNTVTVTLATPLTNVPPGYTIVIAGVFIPPCTQPCNPVPYLAYDGSFPLSTIDVTGTTITYTNAVSGLPVPSAGGTVSFSPQPVFLATASNTAMYVANYNYNSVSAINTNSNFVSNSAPVGVHPVALAETPDGNKLYVANQGSNTVSSLNVVNLSPNAVTGASGSPFSGNTPVWVLARGDSQKVYVLTEGDGQLVTIDTATDMVSSSLPVGAGANFMLLDPNLNRLYVVNPATNAVYVFSDTGGTNDTPSLLSATPLTIPGLGATACPGCAPPVPVSVAALPDGSRFYVASYQIAAPCPDTSVSLASCLIPLLTVFDAASLTPKYGTASTLFLLTAPFATGQYSVPLVDFCAAPVWPAVYTPATSRFRVFTAAAVDSSHVYVSSCDAGVVADILTADNNANNAGNGTPPDTLITDLPTPYSSGATQANGEPPNQNPIFLLTGQ